MFYLKMNHVCKMLIHLNLKIKRSRLVRILGNMLVRILGNLKRPQSEVKLNDQNPNYFGFRRFTVSEIKTLFFCLKLGQNLRTLA